eukprot:gene32646-42280_t
MSCNTFDSFAGATFDLTDVSRIAGQPPYSVEDGDIPCTKNKVEANFTYIFNICGTVTGTIPRACTQLKDLSSASALQVNKRGSPNENDDYCYVVGKYDQVSTKLSLLDSQDPTKGLQLQYVGDYCSGGAQRQFNIQLMCADKMNPVPTHALELSHCQYTITMPSIYGCPLECPVSKRRLCGGNGLCAYDSDKSSARCFCNQGYSGSDCSSSDASQPTTTTLNYSPALLGLIITLFVIILLLIGSLVFMVRQISAYKEDLANYQVLKGSPEDDGPTVV